MDIQTRITNTAIKLFKDFGIRGVTMDTIAKEAGVSKRTIYETYKDKTELLEKCLAVIDQQKYDEMIELKNSATDIIDTIYKLANYHIKSIQSVNPLFFHDLQRFYPKMWEGLITRNDGNRISDIHKLFRKGINDGLIRADIHLEVASRVMLEHFKLALTLELQRNRGYDRNVLFENIIVNYFRGIATAKGIDVLQRYNGLSL